jgi:hypothetical protein
MIASNASPDAAHPDATFPVASPPVVVTIAIAAAAERSSAGNDGCRRRRMLRLRSVHAKMLNGSSQTKLPQPASGNEMLDGPTERI